MSVRFSSLFRRSRHLLVASALAVMFTIAVGIFALSQILISRTVERRIL